MADIQTSAADKKDKEYFTDTPQAAPGFFLKGCHQYDWGLKNRMSRIFNNDLPGISGVSKINGKTSKMNRYHRFRTRWN